MSRIHGIDVPDLGAARLPAPLSPRLERLHFAMRVLGRSLEHSLARLTTLVPDRRTPPRRVRLGQAGAQRFVRASLLLSLLPVLSSQSSSVRTRGGQG